MNPDSVNATSRYTSKPHEALKELNFARKDPEWGERSIRQMIEIYLAVDDSLLDDDCKVPYVESTLFA